MSATLKILLVDDDPAARDLVIDELHTAYADLQVIQVDNAQAFTLWLEKDEFDAVVAEYQLPWTKGIEILQQIKTRRSNCPVILFSSSENDEDVLEAIEAGADDYILKPPHRCSCLAISLRLARERSRQHQEMQAAEAHYHALFVNIPVGIYRSTPDGKIIDANPAIVKMLGYPELDTLLAANAADLYMDRNERARWQSLLEADHLVQCFETRLRCFNGTQLWVRENTRSICDESGRIFCYEGTLEDITEQKRMEDTLWGEKMFSEMVIDSLPGIFFFFDAQEKFIRWNKSAEEITGYSYEEISSMHLLDFFAGEHKQAVTQTIQQVFTEGESSVEAEIVSKDGRRTPYRLNGKRVVFDQAPCVIVIGVDLTRRMQIQREIERSYQQQNALNALLQISLSNVSLEEQLERALDLVLSISWLPVVSKGAIFLVEERSDILVLKTQRNLDDALLAVCSQLPFGKCLCGRAAKRCQTIFASSNDRRHEIRYAGMETHGHYNVPIHLGEEVLGVLLLYLDAEHQRDEQEIAFLETVAGILANLVNRKRVEAAERRRRQEAETLSEITTIVTSTLSLDQVLDDILNQLERVVAYHSVCIFLLEGSYLRAVAGKGFPNASQVIDKKYTAENPLFQEIQDTYRPLILLDAGVDHRFGQWGNTGYTRGWMGVPLVVRGEVIGCLTIDSLQANAYEKAEKDLAQAFANQAAAAIANARLFEEVSRHNQLMIHLAAISERLNYNRTLQDVLEAIGAGCFDLSEADRSAVYVRNQDDSVSCSWSHGLSSAYLEQVTTQIQRVPGGQMLERVEPILIPDVNMLPEEALLRSLAGQEGYRAISLWPLVYEGRVTAALGCYYDEPHTWPETERDVMLAFARQAAAALESARLFDDAGRRLRHLQAMHTIDVAISGSLDLNATLSILLDQVVAQLGVDAADILLLDENAQTLEYATGIGFRTSALVHTHLQMGEGYAGQAVSEQHLIVIPDLQDNLGDFLRSPLLAGEEFVSFFGAPLITRNRTLGVMEIFHRAFLFPTSEWLELLEGLATQASIAIDNATLFHNLQQSNDELASAYDTTLEGWGRALELRDRETEGHTKRVTDLTMHLAQEMGFPDDELVHIRRGALLHDIGKMGVPDTILLKPGPLTEREKKIMEQHPTYAYQMLSPIPFLCKALDIPYCHHEKWDGTGYPRGLKGEEIPLTARLFTIIDVWDALHSDRPYRTAWSEDEIWTHMQMQVGKYFDPQVVEVFLNLVSRQANFPRDQ